MPSDYPLDGEVVCSERVDRWRPLFNWVLVIPLSLWWLPLWFGAVALSVVAWFAIVLSGRLPESIGNYLTGVLRYRWRLLTYLFGFTDLYPGFRVAAGYVDPGDYPAVFYSARPMPRRRAVVLLRAILVIPQLIVVRLVGVIAVVVLFIAWFAVLFTGRWPRRLQMFVVLWMQWSFRVSGYWYLLVDEYPHVPEDTTVGSPFPDRATSGEALPPPPPLWSPQEPAGSTSPTTTTSQQPPADLASPAPSSPGAEQILSPEPVVSLDPAGGWGHSAPADMSSWGPPQPPDAPLDPSAATKPPWPGWSPPAARTPRPGWPAGRSCWGSFFSPGGSPPR